jgi:hypothetical protein
MVNERCNTILGCRLKVFLNLFSVLGYLLLAFASFGYYKSIFFARNLPCFILITIGGIGGLCISIRNIIYHEQCGKIPLLVSDISFIIAINIFPSLPVPNEYSFRITQGVVAIYVIIYFVLLCPWRNSKDYSITKEGG